MFDPRRIIPLPAPQFDPGPGPRLTYTTELRADGSTRHSEVDREAPADARDRAILRGLLTHALALVDQADADARFGLLDVPTAAELTE